jgi:soluble lytic murein transglycosylase
MSLHYSGTSIPEATVSKIRKNASAMTASKAAGSWAMTLDALGTGQEGDPGPDREKILALALNNGSRSPDEAIQYLLTELRAPRAAVEIPTSNSMFSSAENAAIAGRIAVSQSRYREALLFFRMVMTDAPDLFFRYPELLGDLGRTFQYTANAPPSASGKEGIDLFLQWDKNFDEKKFNEDENLNALIRFRLLFFAARIARQSGLPESVDLFERALSRALFLPPGLKGEQTDACIWYILNTSLAKDASQTVRYLERYISNWHDDGYYSDVMDKLARELLLKRRWADIIKIAALVKNHPGVIGAKFAWIAGRAIQAGLIESQEGRPSDSLAETYFRIAYNNAPVSDGKALYYRSLSAAALGEPFFPADLPTTKTEKDSPGESDAMQFLLGFFKHGAARFTPRYSRLMESDLSPEELRQLAEALGNGAPDGAAPGYAGQYQESMRLVSLYMRRDSYQLVRRDLELLYPRPFDAQVNQYAHETGIGPAKLFALIRTESAFNPDAISRSGAIGLTQLMPATAEEMAARILRRGGPDYTRKPDKEGDEIASDAESGSLGGLIASEVGVDLFDPGANIHMGAVYLAWLEQRLGDPLLALLAYNGGMNRVRRWRSSMPAKFPPDLFLETVEYAETMEYGRSVMGASAMYRALYQ